MRLVISVTFLGRKSTAGHSKEYLKGTGKDFSSMHHFEFFLLPRSLLHAKSFIRRKSGLGTFHECDPQRVRILKLKFARCKLRTRPLLGNAATLQLAGNAICSPSRPEKLYPSESFEQDIHARSPVLG